MWRLFSKLFGWLALIIIALGVVAFMLWLRVPDMLANNLSKTLKVKVSIEDMNLGFGYINIENLEIGNVPQGILVKAFSAEKTSIQAPLTRYVDDHIVVDRIQIDDVYLGLEFDSATSTNGNWTRILSNLQQTTDSQDASSQGKSRRKGHRQKSNSAPKSTSNQDGNNNKKTVLIKELVVNNIYTDLVYIQGDGKIKKLPMIKQIVIKNISSEEGFPIDQLMNSVLGQMLTQVFIQQNLKNMIQTLLPRASELNDWIQPFKGLIKP
jgi:hypothetical protein